MNFIKCIEGATKGLRVYKVIDSTVHVYNYFTPYLQYNFVLQFAIYKSSYFSLDKNLSSFFKTKDEIKVLWQQLVHAYHECWYVLWYNISNTLAKAIQLLVTMV